MSTYSIRIAYVVGSYDETPLIMIDAIITNETDRFFETSLNYEATAGDGANTVEAFMAFLSPNGKQLHAFFTTDAFDVFPGAFDLDFGLPGDVLHTFASIDPSTAVIPLPADYVALGFPNADNNWLATL